MRELTFREVIANIKEGEVWENNDRIISCKNGSILMKNKNMIKSDCFLFPTYNLFELRRKEYTFEEAFKAYEEGKEIESLESGDRFKKSISNVDLYWDEGIHNWWGFRKFDLDDIRGKWHIND